MQKLLDIFGRAFDRAIVGGIIHGEIPNGCYVCIKADGFDEFNAWSEGLAARQADGKPVVDVVIRFDATGRVR